METIYLYESKFEIFIILNETLSSVLFRASIKLCYLKRKSIQQYFLSDRFEN
jgi:hypothetical protein